MNLKLHFLSRVALVALLCLLVTAAYSLYQNHRQFTQTTQHMAESLVKQLESQLRLKRAGIGQANSFPDFEVWKLTGGQPGMCITYMAEDRSRSRTLCYGSKPLAADWPDVFESIYRLVFLTGRQIVRSVVLNGRIYGSMTVMPSAEVEIRQAWNQSINLMRLAGVTVLAVCLLVYLSMNRALRPAQIIVAGLAKLEAGDLDFRMPGFKLQEWQTIAMAINQLAHSQQQLLKQRQQLAVKLIHLQEQERRELARELHDEFGQYLAAINAVLTIIKQTAEQQCPDLIDDCERTGRITAHMLNEIRGMLCRLRPPEFDELGLTASLETLIASWNSSNRKKTRYRLNVVGDCGQLSEPLAITVFRIVQEGLTNIHKHAAANNVKIDLKVTSERVLLMIRDDGIARQIPLITSTSGIGLLGIRERMNALHGQFALSLAKPHGLILTARLPINGLTETAP